MPTKTATRAKPPRPSGMERAAIARALKCGMHLVGEGTFEERRWTFYSSATGQQLLIYFPGSFAFINGRQRGTCKNWKAAIRLAAEKLTPAPAEALASCG